MKVGDLVTATWPDGLQVVGFYARTERGYIILLDQKTRTEIPCSANTVHFEIGDTMQETKVCQPEEDSGASWTTVVWSIFIGLIIGKWWWG